MGALSRHHRHSSPSEQGIARSMISTYVFSVYLWLVHAQARDAGVSFHPGSLFSIAQHIQPHVQCAIRLCFACCDEPDIALGIKRLALAFVL